MSFAAESPPPSTEEVVSAIQTLYHGQDPKEKEAASRWLHDLQRSVHAWKAADSLLHAKASLESCYFAAQTMRSKIEMSFHELPAEAHEALKGSLMEHMSSVDENTNPIIVTQLSLALADLALQMPAWTEAVPELAARFGSERPFALLEVLVVLPEEVGSRHLRLGANRRQEVTRQLAGSAGLVAQFLSTCLQSEQLLSRNGGGGVRTSILRCLKSWVEIGAFPLQGIEQNPVMVHAFKVLADVNEANEVHEAAADCAIALLEALEPLDPSQQWCAQLELAVFGVVKNLEAPYLMSVASEDIVKAINFCRVFTELGESLLFRIVHNSAPQTPYFATSVFESILTCCGHPDYEIPDITFNLWYRLSEELYRRGDDSLTALFAPYIERLIAALSKHCQMEPDADDILEEGGDFSEFRNRCVELVKDVVFIVGSANVFRRMFEYLRSDAASGQWEVAEAALFVMAAVARMILPSENDVVPQVLESVLSMPPTTHVAVRHVGLRLVGELAEWMDQQPQYLDRVLNWLLAGLQDPKLSSESATSLQNVCAVCKRHMVPHFEGLTQILRSIDSFSLKPAAANGLLKGVAVILSIMPYEQVKTNMMAIVGLQVAPLSAILDKSGAVTNGGMGDTAAAIDKNSSADPALYLDRISTIFRFVAPSSAPAGMLHPCFEVIENLWPVISRCFDTFPSNVRIMERCSRTVRFAVRCIGTQAEPILGPLVTQMVRIYGAGHPHSCFLYLGSILVDEFSLIGTCVSGLLDMLEAFLLPTFAILTKNENGLRDNPDTVDDFFRLNARFIQRIPLPYLRSGFVNQVVACAVEACSLHHREANASVLKYTFDLLHVGRSKEEREDFAERQALAGQLRTAHGPSIVNGLARAVSVGRLPTCTFHDVGDVVHELMAFDRPAVCKWLEEALTALPTKNPSGVETVTRKQLVQFHKEVTSAESPRDVADAVRQFSRLWR